MTTRQPTVLYVEDNEYNRKIVRQLLSRTGYRLVEASDGEGALDLVREHRPDLVLMDVQLPRMSGLDATRALRADPATADLPVIVVTSEAAQEDVISALVYGANGYMTKPVKPEALLEAVKTILGATDPVAAVA